MPKKAIGVAVVAATLSTVAILYITLQSNTYRVEDILAVYQEHADYGDITIEYPLNETLFPPEIIPPVFRWKDCVPVSRTGIAHPRCSWRISRRPTARRTSLSLSTHIRGQLPRFMSNSSMTNYLSRPPPSSIDREKSTTSALAKRQSDRRKRIPQNKKMQQQRL